MVNAPLTHSGIIALTSPSGGKVEAPLHVNPITNQAVEHEGYQHEGYQHLNCSPLPNRGPPAPQLLSPAQPPNPRGPPAPHLLSISYPALAR